MQLDFRWRDRTFPQALAWAAAHFGERIAVAAPGGRLTYRELLRRVEDFALGLHALGVRRGEHVALWMTDGLEWMIARWAVPSLGAVLVPVNTRLRGEDLRYILDQSDAATLIMDAAHGNHDYLATLAGIVPDLHEQERDDWRCPALPKLRRVIVAGGPSTPCGMRGFAEVSGAARRAAGASFEALAGAVRPGDVAQLLYTSGTTSLPKGAMVCHGPLLENNYHSAERTGMTAGDAYLLTVPSFSASGVAAHCQCLTHGAKLVLMPRFTAAAFCEAVQAERATVAFFADPIVYDLRHFAGRGGFDLSSLRTGSGAPLSDASFDFLVDELGVREATHVYGMSETSNVVSRGCSADPLATRRRSNGRPQPDVEVAIVRPETGEALPADVVGELRVAGYTVMRGYYNKPAETAAAFDEAGRLRTGDLAMLNGQGELVFAGRAKEMLKVGGFNVAPSEIEAFLESCPGVARAAVVGVPDERLGEVPFAFVEPAATDAPSAAALLAQCRDRIAGYKVPRFFAFEGDWPMTSTRKVQKARLRERALALIAGGATRPSP